MLGPLPLLRHQRDDGRHVAADAVSGDGEAAGVGAELGRVLRHVLGDGVALLDRGRIAALRGPVVVDENDDGIGADRELADQAIMRLLVAEHPAAAVNVHDDRQGAGRAGRPHHADVGPPVRADHQHLVLAGDLRQGDGHRLLRAREDGASGVGRERVDGRRAGEAVDENPGRRIEVLGGERRGGHCGGCRERGG